MLLCKHLRLPSGQRGPVGSVGLLGLPQPSPTDWVAETADTVASRS